MAITTSELFTVRSITSDGELVSETEPMDESEGYSTFDDTVQNAGSGIVVQLISEDGRVAAEELIG